MKLLGIGLVLTGFGTPVAAQDSFTIQLLQDVAYYNGICRGGSGDNSSTLQACGARDYIGALLFQKGYCYGKKTDFGFEMQWHKCEEDSNVWPKRTFESHR